MLLDKQAQLASFDTSAMTAEGRAAHDKLVADNAAELATFGNQPMTAAEIAARQAEEAAYAIAAPIAKAKAEAKTALAASDLTALRCFKAGQPFPAGWKAYVNSLRAIANGGTGPMPVQPDFPAGT